MDRGQKTVFRTVTEKEERERERKEKPRVSGGLNADEGTVNIV